MRGPGLLMDKKLVLKNFPDKETVNKFLKEAPKVLRRAEETYRLEMMEECGEHLKAGNVEEAALSALAGDYKCLAQAILLHFSEKTG